MQNDNEIQVSLKLNPDAVPKEQKEMWNYDFKLEYLVTLTANSLKTELVVQNSDLQPFEFTSLLHTYFRVPKVTEIGISGLEGVKFTDSVSNDQVNFVSQKVSTETRNHIVINEEVDRVYENTPDTVKIVMPNPVVVSKQNFLDIVVWNPWAEKAQKMADFGDEEYHEMVCVEVGQVASPVKLLPGNTWGASQTLSVNQ